MINNVLKCLPLKDNGNKERRNRREKNKEKEIFRKKG